MGLDPITGLIIGLFLVAAGILAWTVAVAWALLLVVRAGVRHLRRRYTPAAAPDPVDEQCPTYAGPVIHPDPTWETP